MKRPLVLIALCMHNLAQALRKSSISGALAAQTVDALAEEIKEHDAIENDAPEDPDEVQMDITPEAAALILRAIRNERGE